MASEISSPHLAAPTVVNPNDPQNPMFSVNMSTITHLTTSNYITWSLQVSLFLERNNLSQHISDAAIIPPPTVQVNDLVAPNPAYIAWCRQDKLIFSALLGSISLSLQPLVSTATTTLEAWTTLRYTYGRPSRAHIKQIKEQLRKHTKGQLSNDEHMQFVKTKADQLALLGKPLDHEDFVEFILVGLDDDYCGVVEQVNARDYPPSYDELRDKLVNREAAVLYLQPASGFPESANVAVHKPKPRFRNSTNDYRQQHPPQHYVPHPQHNQQRFSKPYLGRCQACGVQGHSAQRCTQFRITPTESSQSYASQQSSWQPRTNHLVDSTLAFSSIDHPSGLLDTGASHHITPDLNNMNAHAPNHVNEAVILGDGSGHASTHTDYDYEVFISFRGKDERFGFLSHLKQKLRETYIDVFTDDNGTGQPIKDLLVQIRKSKIAIVIFSKNFAESSSCMDELVEIKKCIDTGVLKAVIPIFFEVDVADVKRQSGHFGEKFLALQNSLLAEKDISRNESNSRIEGWKESLDVVTGMIGLSYQRDSSEVSFVKEVVKKVAKIINKIAAEEHPVSNFLIDVMLVPIKLVTAVTLVPLNLLVNVVDLLNDVPEE